MDRVLYRRKVARERSGCCSRRRYIDRRRRLAWRGRDMHMPGFPKQEIALMPRARRRIFLVGMFNLLVAGDRYHVARKRGKCGQTEKTGQRTKGVIHSLVPHESNRTNHEIPRSLRLEV